MVLGIGGPFGVALKVFSGVALKVFSDVQHLEVLKASQTWSFLIKVVNANLHFLAQCDHLPFLGGSKRGCQQAGTQTELVQTHAPAHARVRSQRPFESHAKRGTVSRAHAQTDVPGCPILSELEAVWVPRSTADMGTRTRATRTSHAALLCQCPAGC